MVLLILLFLVAVSEQRSVLQSHDCSYHSSNYSINWTYDELSNDIVFKLTTNSPKFSNFYTAIGFGTEEKPTDVIAVYVRAAQIGLIDGHLAEDGAIESDEKTNVQALQFDLQNGVLTAQFARPIETFDSQDADLGSCINMFLPTIPREIITGAPLELGENVQKIRVCDIAVTCATKMHNDILVKRQEDSDIAPVCATGAEDQKNRIEWKVDGEMMRFSVFQNAKKGRWWTAIGVGESMNDLSMIILFAETGKLKKQGIYRTEGKMQPFDVEYEGIQVQKESAVVNNGRAHFEVVVEKKFFLDRADTEGCFTMQVGQLAGQYTPTFGVQKHQQTPQAIRICDVEACVTPTEPPQEVDGESEKKTTEKLESLVKETVEEASGAVEPTKDAPINDVEGSGLPILPVVVEKTTEKTPEGPESEGKEEKPLTSDDAPRGSSEGSSRLTSAGTPSGTSSGTTPLPLRASSESTDPSGPLMTSESGHHSSTPHANPVVFIVDNHTTAKASDSGDKDSEDKDSEDKDSDEATTKKSENTGCGAEHEDLKVCEGYFAEYLGKVNEWSEKHNMTITSHMWKACTLLAEVQHVTTMCCTIFRNTCATHLDL